eukprot:TRINITY_DN82482_c0_g1_i2.p1 TRINITY_DN82482_c0_g1~~TRINITY_DN82482_c0_g1_i2.p1  ORF type:complete len:504 (-),score=76.46 TRINITY_DN82482_c0_g1_i2:450-1961(-)
MEQKSLTPNGEFPSSPPISEEARQKAEELKSAANQSFKEHHFLDAVNKYSQAIEVNPYQHVYYANRAFAQIKLENFGSAIQDATRAIELEPTYVKAYYRRGDARFCMGKFKEAVKDFKDAAKVAPRDPDIRRKLQECEKEIRCIRMMEALAFQDEHASEHIDISKIVVEDSYTGPRMKTIQNDETTNLVLTLEFVEEMLEEMKEQRLIHKQYAFFIVLEAQKIFKELPSLVDIEIPSDQHFTVCGDIHGQYYDLLNLFKINGLPSPENPYLFNGDFVDRGSFSVEVILTLLAFKVLYPEHMHLTRGNHESLSMNKMYGFEGEVKHKYNTTLFEVFRETFNWLPIAFVLNEKVIVLHGGLFSEDDVSLDDLRKIDRNREPPEQGLMCEALWSDPSDEKGRNPSKRGVGLAFGTDITQDFLHRNNLQLIIRSHEVKDEGYEITHDGRLITVFSAPNYCDQMGNKGAFVKFNGKDMVPHFTQFEAVEHPNVKPMQYASSFLTPFMM